MNSKLKSIELQGYKTFANKTSFVFPLPVTAIVGPNGSGKSNISDSIRWVLGEQSFSLLRGRKTLDMIFSGSDKKPRAGMASATIVFDNSTQWLPIDYEEVAITRRAFRDGQNDYLINGQKVRLKDVNELLAQSGLAERTYTIIGQGLIDNALSARPEDRRRFFEEAAGIGLYHSRREEALTRLEDTAHNLERIADILSELEPRVQSLERQAKRAEEYGRISDELRGDLLRWYGYYWNQAQSDTDRLQEIYNEKKISAEKVAVESKRLESSVAEIRKEVNEVRSKLSTLHAKSSAAHQTFEKINRDQAVLSERLNSVQERLQGCDDEAVDLQDETDLLEERKGDLAADADEISRQVADAAKQKSDYEILLKERQKQLQQMRTAAGDKRNELTRIETSLIRLKAHIDQLKETINTLTESVASMTSLLQRSDTQITAARSEKEKYLQLQSENEVKLKALQEQDAADKAELNVLDQQLREKQKEIDSCNAALTRAKARLDILLEAERNLSGLNRGAQFLVQSVRSGRLNLELRSLQSGLFIEAGYEAAVAAALNDRLDGLLVERTDWNVAMSLLNSDKCGRAILIAPNFSTEAVIAPNPALEKLPALVKVVHTKDGDLSLVERLFCGVFLAENRIQAMEIQTKLRSGELLVTLQGECFRADGSVVCGSEDRTNLLSRTREIEDLKEEVESQRLVLTHLNEQYLALHADTDGLRLRREKAAAERSQIQSVLNQVLRKVGQASIELEKLIQTAALHRKNTEDNRKKIQTAESDCSKDEAEIVELEHCRSDLRAELKELQNKINSVQLSDLQEQVQYWSVSQAVSEKSLAEIQTRIRENEDALVRSRSKQQSNRNRKYELEKQLEDLSDERENLKADSEETSGIIRSLSEQIGPAEILLKDAESRLQQAQDFLQNFHKYVSDAERALSAAQMDLTRQDSRIDSLSRQMQEDFGIYLPEDNSNADGSQETLLSALIHNLPNLDEIPSDLEEKIRTQKNHLHRLGSVNPEAVAEYKDNKRRFDFLSSQMNDLKQADADLRRVIEELDRMMQTAFLNTFEKVQKEFSEMFTRLFGGGSAKLLLSDPENVNASGIEIAAKLPGHREQELSLLSGGERSLTSVALVFALLRVSPTPFCILDEVDAALDEANVGRFCELLKELSRTTQFLVITHNRNTVEASNVIYGITMSADSTSQAVSLKLDEVDKSVLK